MSPTAWAMLTAAVAGDILTIAGGFAAERYRHYREASATKAALSVEARAPIEWLKATT